MTATNACAPFESNGFLTLIGDGGGLTDSNPLGAETGKRLRAADATPLVRCGLEAQR
jgi:hypothetical protein